jgi:hypothetical protein
MKPFDPFALSEVEKHGGNSMSFSTALETNGLG